MCVKLKNIFIVFLIVGFFIWGFAVGKYRTFPYSFLQNINWSLKSKVKATGNEFTQFDIFKPDVDFVFIGDSITAGGNWHDMFPEHSLANRGIGGETIREIALRLQEIDDLKPKAVFLMAGVNDVGRGETLENMLQGFRTVVDHFTRQGIAVYLQSTIQCSVNSCGEERLNKIKSLNHELVELANNSDLVSFVELNSFLSDDSGLKKDLTNDGIHLNAKGYSLWRDFLKKEIAILN